MKLANCPFCGGEYVHICTLHNNRRYVKCPSCDAEGPIKETKKQAKQSWNSVSPTEQNTKTFDFSKALKLMKKGKKVSRKSWQEDEKIIMFIDKNKDIIYLEQNGKKYVIWGDEKRYILSTDWIMVE